jgi:cytochrome P450
VTSTLDLTAPRIPDLSDPHTFLDGVPHAAFAAIQQMPGLYWQPTTVATIHGGFWAVTRFADVSAIEKQPELFSSARGAAYPLTQRDPIEHSQASIIQTDPPTHTRLRQATSKGFAPKVVANFAPWIREIVREAVADVADQDEFDFVAAFGRRVPAGVIARIVGVPPEGERLIVQMTLALFAATQDTDGLAEGEGTQSKIIGPRQAIADYAAELQEIKRIQPADDMATALTGCVDRGEISQREFLSWMNIMIGAGFETTHSTISQSMRMYLEDPEIRDATDRAIAEGRGGRASDEFIRLVSAPMQMSRTATRDVDMLGEHIREGDVLVLYFIAANRDPAVFSEPDRFNPWRSELTTLAFGSGVHRCIGSHLAKLEVQILWEELAAAGIRLRLNGEPRRGLSNFINQLDELPVARL